MIEGDDLELFERSIRAATETRTGAVLDAALDELGWQDALEVDPRAATGLLFRLQGESNATSSALERVLLHALGVEVAAGTRLALPAINEWDAPGRRDGSDLRVHGLVAGGLDDGDDTIIVMTGTGDALRVRTTDLDRRSVDGLDPTMGLVELTGTVPAGDRSPAAGDWTTAVAAGRRGVAHELIGASRTMLALAREHALERIQFGVPIASFQAVRHRLAETLVAIETASALLDAAWLDGSELTATMAKAAAGREARVAAKHCQQVLAGIGFTTEHDLHRYVRRVFVLDGLFGTSKALSKAIGDQLVVSRQLPPLLPL